jgi:histidinol phosphatase-like enzyme
MQAPIPRRRAPRPIPGAEQPVRGLFVDRFGTLLESPGPAGFRSFDSAHISAAAVDALFRISRNGWNVYLVGNEDAVANGKVSDAQWADFERDLLEFLRKRGVAIQRNYACLDDIAGKGAHKKLSVFRFPDTGVFFHAAQLDGIDLRRSYLIGDSTLEIAAASRAGLKTLGVRTGFGCRDESLAVAPDVRVDDVVGALELFLRSEDFALR